MSILRNAADVLGCFGTDCPHVTVSEVSQKLDMPMANASRLLKAMRDAGLLETIGDSKRHRPGRLMLDLAAAFRHSSGLIGRAGEVVAEVVRRFGHTGYVSVLNGRDVTAVADYPGSNALRVVSTLGRRLPAHLSATGRSLLARLEDEDVMRLYAGIPAVETLPARLADVRAQGFATSEQETTPGVNAIGIAVADPQTDEAVSLCIVYPFMLVDATGRDEMITALGEGAARIAADLGDTAFVAPRLDARGLVE
jgi:DNA-binding IclR family transcriptional regulator